MKIYSVLFAVALGLTHSTLMAQETDPESAIGYETVAEAFTALSQDPDATQSEYEGWQVFNKKDNGVYTLWSFTPDEHNAHPTAIRRKIVSQNGEILISMDALCHNEKKHCDQLMEDFREINENIKAKNQ